MWNKDCLKKSAVANGGNAYHRFDRGKLTEFASPIVGNVVGGACENRVAAESKPQYAETSRQGQ